MYSSILVPLDGSDLAERAMPHVQGLAKPCGATVHLIQVVECHPKGSPAFGPGVESHRTQDADFALQRQIEEAQSTAVHEYLDHMADKLRSEGIKAEASILEGAAYENIIDYARRHSIELIVMSSHGHGGLRRMLLGSTTDRVIRGGEIPVMVIP